MSGMFVRLTGTAAAVALLSVACADTMSKTTSKPAVPHHSRAPVASAIPAADLRTGLNTLLAEHVLLAGVATGHALGGRDVAFKAAAGALDANSVDIAKAIGSVYGPDAEQAFLPLWRRHIGFVVDYTVGLATKDAAKQTKAVSELVQYTQDLGAFLSSANPNLPKDVVAELVKTHILTLKPVIDARAAKDWPKVCGDLRAAAGHMQMIADSLAGAVVKQFPEKYAQR